MTYRYGCPVWLCLLALDASAQSQVTLYGLVDLGLARNMGSSVKAEQESTPGNSRLGFRGSEDLGDGYKAIFGLETRFRPDSGATFNPNIFWTGYSTVGIASPVGTLNLGRQYTAPYTLFETPFDPWLGLSVAQMRDIALRPGSSVQGLSGSPSGVGVVSRVRVSQSVRYDYSGNNLNFGATFADHKQEGGTATGPRNPWSVAANYSIGALMLGAAFEKPQGNNDRQWNLGARYSFGHATFYAAAAGGQTEGLLSIHGRMIAADVTIGLGDIKMGYGESRVGSGPTAVERHRVGLGYWYALSKRTRLLADVAHESRIANNRFGVDLGILHSF